LDGVKTKVFKNTIDFAGHGNRYRYVRDLKTARPSKDHVAGMIVMRLEPKEIAQDVYVQQ